MIPTRIPAFMFIGLLLAPTLQGAEVNVQWQQPEKYTDIEANNLVQQQKFEQRVIDELSRHIQSAADRYLEPDQQLHITVTDINLAGDVDYFFTRFNQPVRVVTNMHFPSIEFSYELRDANGNVIQSDEENVRDMGFQFSGVYRVNDAELGYEKRMIDDWFEKEFDDS